MLFVPNALPVLTIKSSLLSDKEGADTTYIPRGRDQGMVELSNLPHIT